MENQSLSPPSPDQAFPMLAIAVLSITSSALFIFIYYFFFNKCWHQWSTLRRNTRQPEDSFIALSPSMWMNRGLDESQIREIPMFQYTKEANNERNIDNECIVCLNEFRDLDMVRVLPSCSHSFHLDCIDIWLQSNANCPLCRTSISGSSKYPLDQIIVPSSSPQGPQSQPYSGSLMGGDEDFVVIELGSGVEHQEESLLPREQRENRSETTKCQSPGAKLDQKKPKRSKPRKRSHFSIMGDECINTRAKDEQFLIQPIRRSFSLDSAVDQQLYISVQAVTQQMSNNRKEESSQRSFLFKYQLM